MYDMKKLRIYDKKEHLIYESEWLFDIKQLEILIDSMDDIFKLDIRKEIIEPHDILYINYLTKKIEQGCISLGDIEEEGSINNPHEGLELFNMDNFIEAPLNSTYFVIQESVDESLQDLLNKIEQGIKKEEEE